MNNLIATSSDFISVPSQIVGEDVFVMAFYVVTFIFVIGAISGVVIPFVKRIW